MIAIDDAFKSAASALASETTKDSNIVEWPSSLQWLPCSQWTRHTWHGLSAIFSGACIMCGLGIVNIWGGLALYFTGKFRGEDPSLILKNTLLVYPITLASMTVTMQLGAWLLHKINLKLQLFIGTLIYFTAIFTSQYIQTFTNFVLVFSVWGGFGFGIIFFLPIACAWSYFPTIKPLVGGSILSWTSLSSLLYYYFAH